MTVSFQECKSSDDYKNVFMACSYHFFTWHKKIQ